MIFTHFVDGHDIRMVQAGGGFGFILEPLHVGGRRQLPGADHLQCRYAVEPDLPRLIHDSHAAPTNFLQQLVISNGPVARFGRRSTSNACAQRFGQTFQLFPIG